MPAGKDTPFNVTILGFMLAVTLFTQSPHLHGACAESSLVSKMTCHFFHANMFHFLCNAYAVWLMRPSPLLTLAAFPYAVIATYVAVEPTIGFSAVLYAYMGMNAMRWKASAIDWMTFAVANFVTIFIPGVAFAAHLAAFGMGLAHWLAVRMIENILKKLE